MKLTLGKRKSLQTSEKTAAAVTTQPVQHAVQKNRPETPDNHTIKDSMKELVGKRSRNSRTFKIGGGLIKTEYHGNAINYYDTKSKTFKNIDNRLVEQNGELETRANEFKTKFKKHAKDGKIFDMEIGNCKVGLISCDSANNVGCGLEECGCGDHDPDSSKVILRNVKADTDFEYTVDSTRVKENIIVKAKAEKYEYNFKLDMENLFVSVSKDGKTLELIRKSSGTVQFYIPSPFMTDASGEYSDSVYYEIVQKTPDQLNLKVVADADWINAEERVLPVTIDPEIRIKEYTGVYYGEPQYDEGIFRYETYKNNKIISYELKLYEAGYIGGGYIHDPTKTITCKLIIRKNKINPQILSNIKKATLKLWVDRMPESKYGYIAYPFSGNLNSEKNPQQIQADFTYQLGLNNNENDIEIIFYPYSDRGGVYFTDMHFYSPVLELEYNNAVTGIEIERMPNKTHYLPGDKLDDTGMLIKAIHINGDKNLITKYNTIPSMEDDDTDNKLVTFATYDDHITVIYNDENNENKEFRAKSAKGTITVDDIGFNDRRPVSGRENMYKMYYVNIDGSNKNGGEYIKLELSDGADSDNAAGTALNAFNLNNNITVKAENIRGIIDENNLPEHLRQNNES